MKRLFIGSTIFAALAVAVGVGIVTTSAAQQGQFAHINAQAEGDDAVVVTVSGLPVTRGEVRKASTLRRIHDTTMTEDQADAATITLIVNEKAVLAEGIARDLTPTEDELDTFIAAHKADCATEEARALCEEVIRDTGFSYDEFWAEARPDYSDALLSMKVHRDNFEELELTEDSTNEELLEAERAFEGKVLAAATIVWADERLERLYGEAVVE